MITIEIPQGLGQKPAIFFRPESLRHTPFGKIGLEALEFVKAKLAAPAPEAVKEEKETPPEVPTETPPLPPVGSSAPSAPVQLGESTKASPVTRSIPDQLRGLPSRPTPKTPPVPVVPVGGAVVTPGPSEDNGAGKPGDAGEAGKPAEKPAEKPADKPAETETKDKAEGAQ